MSTPQNAVRPRPEQRDDFWLNVLLVALGAFLLGSIALVIAPVALAAVITLLVVKATGVKWWWIALAAYTVCAVLIAFGVSPFEAIEGVMRKADRISDKRDFDVAVRRIWTHKAAWWSRTVPAIPVGVGVGALVSALWPNYSPFDPRRIIRRQREIARARKTAAKRTGMAPEVVKGLAVLGPYAHGDLTRPWVERKGPSRYLCVAPQLLGRHVVIVGKPGSGKTTSLLRLAYLAAKVYGWRVYFLDGKGDVGTMHEFTSLMLAAGVPPSHIAAFPNQPLDGWRTSPDPAQGYCQLLNRLIGALSFTEPYYRDMTRRCLSRALRAGESPPRSSSELLDRLARVASDSAAELRAEARSAHARYESLFDSFPDLFNGDWSFDDRRAAYVLLKGLSNRDEAQQAAGYIFECFKQFATDMKTPEDKVLLIVDEFPAVTGDSDAAGMIERLRSFGCGVALSGQSYDGLGRDRARIIEAAGALILHRLSDSDDLARLAGTIQDYAMTAQIDLVAGVTGRGTVTPEHRFKAEPNVIGRQADGEVTVIVDRCVGHGFVTRTVAPLHANAVSKVLARATRTVRDPERTEPAHEVVELR